MNADHRREADVNQGRAADPAHSVFVIANAGSGKTKGVDDPRVMIEARLVRRNQIPLSRACILPLVDQDVINPSVELVEHPRRGVRLTEKVQRALNQVVKIERAGAVLGARIVLIKI